MNTLFPSSIKRLTASNTESHIMGEYKGSCHCGFISYTVHLDFANPTPILNGASATKCNCSICHKTGYLLADPGADPTFTLLSPPEGESALTDYTFHNHRVHHPFCPKCGVRCYLRGSYILEGKEFSFMRINVLTLDGRVDGEPMEDVRKMKIKYWNLKDNKIPKAPADEPYEGGAR